MSNVLPFKKPSLKERARGGTLQERRGETLSSVV